MAEAGEHRRAGRRGLVAADQLLAGFEQRERLRRVDAERLEHLGGEHFAHPALERQASVGGAAVGRGSRTLGAEVEQAVSVVAQLGEEEAAAVADVGIVHAELVAVIAQRERCLRLPGSGSKRQKCAVQAVVVEIAKADAVRPAAVEEARVAAAESAPARPDRKSPGRAPGSWDRAGKRLACPWPRTGRSPEASAPRPPINSARSAAM